MSVACDDFSSFTSPTRYPYGRYSLSERNENIIKYNTMPARGMKTDNDGRNELFEWFYRGRCTKIKIRSRKELWEIVKTFRIPIVRGEHARISTRSVTYWSRSAAGRRHSPPPNSVLFLRWRGRRTKLPGPARHILLFTTTIITIIYFKTAPKLLFLNVCGIYTKYINKFK